MAGRLQDKVAIVTGAGTGIGRAIAVLFAREGASAALCGRTRSTLEETARQGGGDDVAAIQCDVSDAGAVQAMVAATVERFGGVDVLVNNAGVRASIGTILELSEEEWQRTPVDRPKSLSYVPRPRPMWRRSLGASGCPSFRAE